jgi:rod shape-determining protein MreD
MQRTVSYSFLSLLFLVFQTVLVKFLVIGEIVPDIILMWIVYIAIRDGQIPATTAGFFLGIIMDMLSGQDGMLGVAALSKTVAGFVAGYFHNENKTLQTLSSYEFLIAIAVASFVHNVIYFVIFLQGTTIGLSGAVFRYGVPTTLYTTALGLIPMFAFARKYSP